MKTVCELNKCVGCMACINICHQKAINIEDSIISLNALINQEKCVNCGSCFRVCQVNHPLELNKTLAWKQGWIEDDAFRKKSSSGGLATAIAEDFTKSGGFVCSCEFKNGSFVFSITNDIAEIEKFRGSKYVKSNPIEIYSKIEELLKKGEKVLFIGLPCQVGGLKKYFGNPKNLYTIDLICHGTPSPKILEFFLNDYNTSLKEINNISFRENSNFCIKIDDKLVAPVNTNDYYTYTFLNSIIYTENCYDCVYATRDRISDLTLGDSWGTELGIENEKKGISLVLAQTQKGLQLMKKINARLYEVDIEKAIIANHQLEYPSKRTSKRDKFLKLLTKSLNFNRTFRVCFPEKYYKLKLKKLLFSLKIK